MLVYASISDQGQSFERKAVAARVSQDLTRELEMEKRLHGGHWKSNV